MPATQIQTQPVTSNQDSTFFNLISNHKNKALIIEGFNKEGKSTLAQSLSELMGREAIQFPLKLPESKNLAEYAKTMLDVRDRLGDKIVERYGLTLIAYYRLNTIEDMVEDILRYMRDNAVVITSTSFWSLVQFKLRDYPLLKDLAKDLRLVLLHPYLLRKPDFMETVMYVDDIDTVWFIRNKLNNKGLLNWLTP